MSMIINDESVAKELIAKRRASGADRFDEVWEGVYVMAPMANNEHQDLASEFTAILRTMVDWQGLGRTQAGANVSDRQEAWTDNYRVPDVLVFLNETSAADCGTHWFGGPDFAIEIVSPGDRALEKLDFYAAVGTRELLIIDRQPWQLTLYRIDDSGKLKAVAISSWTQDSIIEPVTVPIAMSVDKNDACIRVADRTTGQVIREIPISQ